MMRTEATAMTLMMRTAFVVQTRPRQSAATERVWRVLLGFLTK